MPNQEGAIIRSRGYGAASAEAEQTPVGKNHSIGLGVLFGFWTALVLLSVLTARAVLAIVFLPLTLLPFACAAVSYGVLRSRGTLVRPEATWHEFSRFVLLGLVSTCVAVLLKGLAALFMWLIVLNFGFLFQELGIWIILVIVSIISIAGVAMDAGVLTIVTVINDNRNAGTCREAVFQASLIGVFYRAVGGMVAMTVYIVLAFTTWSRDTELHSKQPAFLLAAAFSNLVWCYANGAAAGAGAELWARSACDAGVTRSGKWNAYMKVWARCFGTLLSAFVVATIVPATASVIHFVSVKKSDFADSAAGLLSAWVSPWYLSTTITPLLVFAIDEVWMEFMLGMISEVVVLNLSVVALFLLAKRVHGLCLHSGGGGIAGNGVELEDGLGTAEAFYDDASGDEQTETVEKLAYNEQYGEIGDA